ncbi:GNAT family N-acetyltransferase [Brevibacillus dissolubilis]|uniref:GNAT family N-acetyltransferase n=1 Tax=Brevibacillus dissolubilis TaxID=1844116 RepID=UPI00159BED94|nr:GNAT family N-acetyltransferase [Brevibacillus dissolubilis]
MSMIKRAVREEIPEIAGFVAPLNAMREHFVAWLTMDVNEIIESLTTLPYIPFEDCFVVTRDEADGRITGVLGFIAFPEKAQLRLLGPYVTPQLSGEAWQEMAASLYQHMLELVPENITNYRVSVDTWNRDGLAFAERYGYVEYNGEANLEMDRSVYEQYIQNAPKPMVVGQLGALGQSGTTDEAERSDHSETLGQVIVEAYTPLPEYEQVLRDLQPEQAFFTAQEILNRLNDNNQMYIVRDAEGMQGFIYIEFFPESKHMDVAFIRVRPEAQNRKYGSLLLRHALDLTFARPDMDTAGLYVAHKNTGARRLYERFYFKEKHVVVSMETHVTK